MKKQKKGKDTRATAVNLGEISSQKPFLKDNTLTYYTSLALGDFAAAIEVPDYEVIKYFFMKGIKMQLNAAMTSEQIKEFCTSKGYTVKKKDPISDEQLIASLITSNETVELTSRNPVVSILGHVDHGKTTLLDTIRRTRVAEGEKGGITQSIGAYIVEHKGRKITFLDTPGHEAFIKMRQRGARATDISIIVVAADDGVKPQTKEAIKHAKNEKVSIIVAVNKIDKPDIDIEKLKAEMMDEGIVPEEYGGDVPFVEISAKMNKNIDTLLEEVLLRAEVLDLKTPLNKMPTGVVIEGYLDSHLGPVSTLLVDSGTLNAGDIIVVGTFYGKVRNMMDENNKQKKTALPTEPVRVTGLPDVPNVGDFFVGVSNEKEARQFCEVKKDLYLERKKGLSHKAITQHGNKEVVNLIIRADSQGSVEALSNMLSKYNFKNTHINMVSLHAGRITQTDIDLAEPTNSLIIGFNIGKISKDLESKIKYANASLITSGVIYEVTKKVEDYIVSIAKPIEKVEIKGKADVKALFAYGTSTAIGCELEDGNVKKEYQVRLITQGKSKAFDMSIKSLRRFKNEVDTVLAGQEFGVILDQNEKIKAGDVLEFYVKSFDKPSLEDLLAKES